MVEAAVHIRGELEALGLVPFVKTSGGKGIHVVVPIKPKLGWKKVASRRPARSPRAIAGRRAETFTTTMGKENRKRRIFIDFHRNARSATAAAPYSLRARTQPAGLDAARLGRPRVHRRSRGFELFFAAGLAGRVRRSLGGH